MDSGTPVHEKRKTLSISESKQRHATGCAPGEPVGKCKLALGALTLQTGYLEGSLLAILILQLLLRLLCLLLELLLLFLLLLLLLLQLETILSSISSPVEVIMNPSAVAG